MESKATLIGGGAIGLWALLALFTAGTGGIPPFQLLAITFAIGGLVGLLVVAAKGRDGWRKLKLPAASWLLGVGGLFGYHFFYFTALANAPVADASLIAFLWPLLIVLFSAFLPGERLRWFHVLGAIAGMAGAALLMAGGGGFAFSSDHGLGYLAALACALIWSSYSVVNRTQDAVPTEAVAGFCLATALLAALCHLAFESWIMPSGGQWLAILLLGLGPVGAAFYMWDFGTKRGNLRLLGVCSYGAPLLSTILLVLAGHAEAGWTLGVACLLITVGAVIASMDRFGQRTPVAT